MFVNIFVNGRDVFVNIFVNSRDVFVNIFDHSRERVCTGRKYFSVVLR